MTSATVSGRNPSKEQPAGAAVKDGGGELSVDARTPATFASKKAWAASAVMTDGSGTRPRPHSLQFILL